MGERANSDASMEAWQALVAFVRAAAKSAERDMADLPITPAQYLAMNLIDRRGPQRQTDLAAALRTTQASVSQMISRMTDAELVESEQQGRAKLIALTPEGSALLETARPRHRAHVAAKFEPLTPQELTTLRDLVRKLLPDEG